MPEQLVLKVALVTQHEQILCYFGPLLFDPCSHIEEGVDAFLTVELDNSSSRMSFLMQLATKQILTERHTVQQLLDKFCPQSEVPYVLGRADRILTNRQNSMGS